MNWKLILTYDGTPFHGWQIQPGLRTIQGTLAATLHGITGETILPQGAGRTDSGVHALGQIVSFRLEATIPAQKLQLALNRALPSAIRVLSAEAVPDDFHARHSARGKTYEYRIFERRLHADAERTCSPFLAPYVWDCRWPLNLGLMQSAAHDFLGTHDFTSFSASDPDLTARQNDSVPYPEKTVTASVVVRENDLLIYRVTGSGFLHHMVRNFVGTLADIGRGALPLDAIPPILAARDRAAAGPTAPAGGLFLHTVYYP